MQDRVSIRHILLVREALEAGTIRLCEANRQEAITGFPHCSPTSPDSPRFPAFKPRISRCAVYFVNRHIAPSYWGWGELQCGVNGRWFWFKPEFALTHGSLPSSRFSAVPTAHP
jgi:hypothetical protein